MYKNDACILTADDIYKLKTPLYIHCLLGSFRFYSQVDVWSFLTIYVYILAIYKKQFSIDSY